MNAALTGPLMTWGGLKVLAPSVEWLRKMRVALSNPPPVPAGRSFHARYKVPLASRVLLGASNCRESWPGAVSITPRFANPQNRRTSPAPCTRATEVIRVTVALATSTAATNCVPLVTSGLVVHAARSNCSQVTYTVPPAGTGCDPGVVGAQVSEAEICVVRQCTPSVESESITGPCTNECA